MQFWGSGTALPFGDFDVNITVPDHVMEATGELMNRSEATAQVKKMN
jgi:hypothetical protein